MNVYVNSFKNIEIELEFSSVLLRILLAVLYIFFIYFMFCILYLLDMIKCNFIFSHYRVKIRTNLTASLLLYKLNLWTSISIIRIIILLFDYFDREPNLESRRIINNCKTPHIMYMYTYICYLYFTISRIRGLKFLCLYIKILKEKCCLQKHF